MKQKMRASPERVEAGLKGKESQVGTATVGHRNGEWEYCQPGYKAAKYKKLLTPRRLKQSDWWVVPVATLSTMCGLYLPPHTLEE